jgi:Na+/H+ antiporter NhaD/arsenite permease-like protein
MTVAIASSVAFLTPVSSPVNTLVLASGGYRFSDFVKTGVPVVAVVAVVIAITLLTVPLLFPFSVESRYPGTGPAAPRSPVHRSTSGRMDRTGPAKKPSRPRSLRPGGDNAWR